jgi:hypothetical protein
MLIHEKLWEKQTFEKGDFVRFWILMDWDNEICPMLGIAKEITL